MMKYIRYSINRCNNLMERNKNHFPLYFHLFINPLYAQHLFKMHERKGSLRIS